LPAIDHDKRQDWAQLLQLTLMIEVDRKSSKLKTQNDPCFC